MLLLPPCPPPLNSAPSQQGRQGYMHGLPLARVPPMMVGSSIFGTGARGRSRCTFGRHSTPQQSDCANRGRV